MTRPRHQRQGGSVAKLNRIPERVGSVPDRVKPLPKVALPFYHSREWRALVRTIKAKRGNWCERCGSTKRVIADHIIEIKDGGPMLDESNVELLCQTHHQRKTAQAAARRAGRG